MTGTPDLKRSRLFSPDTASSLEQVDTTELICNILSNLHLSPLLRLMTVSIRFREAVNSVLDDLTVLDFSINSFTPSLLKLLHKLTPNVTHFLLDIPSYLDGKRSSFLAGVVAFGLRNLNHLKQVSLNGSDYEFCRSFVDNFPLNSLEYFYCQFDDVIYDYVSLDFIDVTTTSKLRICTFPVALDTDSVICLSPSLPPLFELHCSAAHFAALTSDVVHPEVTSELVKLTLYGPIISLKISLTISRCLQLKHLSLPECLTVPCPILDILYRLHSFNSLFIPWDYSFDSCRSVTLQRVEVNSLDNCCSLCSAPFLTEISVSQCPSVVKFREKISLENLRVLSITEIVSDSLLSTLALEAKYLIKLDLSLSSLVHQNNLLVLIGKVEALTLRGNLSVVSGDISISHLPRLREVHLLSQGHASDVSSFIRACINVRRIQAEHVTLSFEVLEGLEYVHSVFLSGCVIHCDRLSVSNVDLGHGSGRLNTVVLSQLFNGLGLDFYAVKFSVGSKTVVVSSVNLE
ncbi:hypothetical protein RCL1_000866 [Eukaryota sp. TZLM3-RCL]